MLGDSRPLLLGHRGSRRQARENTLAAFELALAHGCDGFEFDVRLTADGRAVVCHDPHLLGVEVARSTYATLLSTFPDLATFDEVLAQFATRAYLCIELKVCGLEKVVLRTLCAHPPECGYVVASFLPDVLRVMRALSADVPLGLICNAGRELMGWHNLPVSVVMPHYRLATEAVVQELHAAGKQVFVWTVNRAGTMRQFAALGVDAIASDDTALLARAV